MSRARRVTLTCLVAVVALAGCSSGSSAVRTLAQRNGNAAQVLTRNADTLPDGSAVLRATAQGEVVLPPRALSVTPASVEQTTVAIVSPHADDLTDDELLDVVEAACTANSSLAAGTAASLQEAAEQAVGVLGLGDTPASRVQGLARDLREAETSTDVVLVLAEFALCGTAQPR